MKKVILILAIGSSFIFADGLTNMITKEIVSSKKDDVRKVIVKSTGNKVIGNQIADKVVGKQKKKNPVDKLKSDLIGNLIK